MLGGWKGKSLAALVALAVIYFKFLKSKRAPRAEQAPGSPPRKSAGKGNVDKLFWSRVWKLVRISFPRLYSKQTAVVLVLSVCLVLRTWMSIRLADIQGQVVQSIVNIDL